ncbi:MAG: hypothetical protein CM1200mP27_11590 [Chloroflexota bacterium]|nr:MAG: hypothetical protein CM1200mP27_11590 [Chloroflexota bacterium]
MKNVHQQHRNEHNVFEGDSVVKEYVGDYDDWLRQRRKGNRAKLRTCPQTTSPPVKAPKARVKLRFSEKKNWMHCPKLLNS